jgi:thioredoxin-related protein
MNRKLIFTVILLIICFVIIKTSKKTIPQDLEITGTTGSVIPYGKNYTLIIDSSGYCTYAAYIPADLKAKPEKYKFNLKESEVKHIWNTIEQNNFFALKPKYIDENVDDGAYTMLTVKARGITHSVYVQNTVIPCFEAIIQIINKVTPSNKDLICFELLLKDNDDGSS